MLTGLYFDGRSPEQKIAHLWFDASDAQFVVLKTWVQADIPENLGADAQAVQGQSLPNLDTHQRRHPVRTVDFGEPTQQGQRIIRFENGGQFVAADALQAHTYLNAHQHSGGWVAGITLKWQWVMAAFAGTVAAVAVLYTHGIPLIARLGAPHIPQAVSQTLGDQAFEQLDKSHFKPSALSADQQQAIHNRWAAFLAKQAKTTEIPKHTVYIRSMPITTASLKRVEIPNAMALPNGNIVLTDGLIKLLEDRPDAVMGVLAHELGHLDHRHSMRLLIEVSALSGLSAIVLGDASGLITQAPLLLGVLSYSRDHEGEADDSAIQMMRAAGVPSSELAVFFERARDFITILETSTKTNKPDDNKVKSTAGTTADPAKEKAESKKKSWDIQIPDWLSTHPSDAARIEKLKRGH